MLNFVTGRLIHLQQSTALSLDRDYSPKLERYLIDSYSRKPDGQVELAAELREFDVDALTTGRILAAVNAAKTTDEFAPAAGTIPPDRIGAPAK